MRARDAKLNTLVRKAGSVTGGGLELNSLEIVMDAWINMLCFQHLCVYY